MSELIEIEVYSYDDPTKFLDVLNGRTKPSYMEEIAGPGGGDLTLSLTDPKLQADATLLAYRNLLKVRVNGKVVGGCLVGKKNSKIVGDSAAKEVYKVSGEGLRTWFGDAIVYPVGGLRRTSYEERSFNFASEQGDWYKPGQWVAPFNVVGWGDIAGSPWRYAPAQWPDVPAAQWIWSENSYSGAPAGDNFFRYEFTTATDGKYSFFVAADDSYTVYIDGQLNTASDPDALAWTEVNRIDVDLEAGPHVFGVRVTNKETGPAALIAAIFRAGDATVGTAAELVTATGSSGWLVAGYPDPVPGWSPGEIMLTLLAEAEARGVHFPLWITPTFTNTLDSYGNEWPRDLDWSFGVGDDLTSVIEKLEELVCDVWIDPDTLEFNMVVERGVDRSVLLYKEDGVTVDSAPLTFVKGKNLLDASTDGVGEIKNSLIIQTSDGWMVAQDSSDSIGKYGVVEAMLETGVSSAVSTAVAAAVFEQKANPEEGASYDIIPTPDHVPFEDFQVGDWVLAPDETGLLVKRRVMSISVEEDSDNGQPTYSVEFDTIFKDNEDKLSRWMSKMGGGALGGQFANSGSGSSLPIGQPTIPPAGQPLIKFPLAPANLTATSVGLWSLNGVDAYSQVTLEWDAVTGNTDGSATVPSAYEVWGHPAEDSDYTYRRLALVFTNTAVLQPYATGSEWVFKVRALNSADAASSFSDPIDHTMEAPNVPMAAPSAPTLASNKGVLIVSWDGLLLGSSNPPPQFRYVYALVAPDVSGSAGTYVRMGATLSRDGRNLYISGLTIGDKYWVKLISVDGLGLESADSGSSSTTLTGIDLGDLDSSIQDAIDAAHQAGLDARSMNNMLNGGSFEENDPALWSLETSGVTNQTTNPHSGSRALRIDSTTSDFVASKYGLVLEVSPGETYQFSAWVRSFGAGTTEDSGLTLSVAYGPDATASADSDELAGSPEATATYLYFAGTWTVPANTYFAKPQLVMSDDGGSNSYLVDDLVFRMVIPGALIVNGAITADKIGAGEVTATAIAAEAITAEKIQAAAVTAGKIAAGAVTAETIAANAVTANAIEAGSITTLKLSSEVGQELDISSNNSVNILVGQIDAVTDDQNATAGSLETMQTYYQFGPDGAVISAPSSPFAIHIANDRIEMLQLNVPVSYWNAGQMFVNSLVGTEVVLGNHKIEKYGTGTVVRAL